MDSHDRHHDSHNQLVQQVEGAELDRVDCDVVNVLESVEDRN